MAFLPEAECELVVNFGKVDKIKAQFYIGCMAVISGVLIVLDVQSQIRRSFRFYASHESKQCFL